jgi:hypothetical protein
LTKMRTIRHSTASYNARRYSYDGTITTHRPAMLASTLRKLSDLCSLLYDLGRAARARQRKPRHCPTKPSFTGGCWAIVGRRFFRSCNNGPKWRARKKAGGRSERWIFMRTDCGSHAATVSTVSARKGHSRQHSRGRRAAASRLGKPILRYSRSDSQAGSV